MTPSIARCRGRAWASLICAVSSRSSSRGGRWAWSVRCSLSPFPQRGRAGMSEPADPGAFAARDEPGRVIVAIWVTPRARRETLTSEQGQLRARLRAAPVEGAANTALIALLAERLDLPRRDITIVRGATAREKQVAIAGQTSATLRQRLRLDPA